MRGKDRRLQTAVYLCFRPGHRQQLLYLRILDTGIPENSTPVAKSGVILPVLRQ
jgi:hypothetical protein